MISSEMVERVQYRVTVQFLERLQKVTLKIELLTLITDYKFNHPKSADAEIIVDFSREMNFDQHNLRGKKHLR